MKNGKIYHGYEGLYQVSNLGRIKSLKLWTGSMFINKEKILKPTKYKNGYLNVILKGKHFLVHRIVALTFLENKNNLPIVNHINGIKTDNRVENLEWCTYSHNEKEAYKIGIKNPKPTKAILQYDLDGNLIREWKSISQIKKELGYSTGNIYIVLARTKDKQHINAYGDLRRSIKMRRFFKVSRVKDLDFDLPKRGTKKSAGYDFINPERVEIPPYKIGDNPVLIKTGVKAKMQDDEVLMLYNRSSNPKKKKLVIPNSVGIIDADYYGNKDNDGEIGFTFYNLSSETVVIEKGEKLGQGVFVKYLITEDDNAEGTRKGGFGSTGK